MEENAERDALARAARSRGVDIDADVLLAIVHTAFAPRQAMTADERRFLIEAGAPTDSFDPARQAEARARLSALAAETAAAAAERLTTSEVADRLGTSESRVRKLAAGGDLYAIRDAVRGRLAFPAWQFIGDQPLRGLRRVLPALPRSMHPLSLEEWMTTSKEELDDRTPVEWLARGGSIEEVVRLADSHARQ